MSITEAKAKANARSQKKNNKTFTLKLSRNLDKDMIEWLESQENRNAYLKALIRKDMK